MQAPETQSNCSKSQQNIDQETAPPASQEPPLPRRFERYTLLKRLARGGMGEVLLASSGGIEGAERPVVVKIIRKEHEQDRSFLARFLDEARIQAQLQHPGVAQILEATTDSEGKPFVVVEYVEGRNLSDVRSRAGQLNVRISWPEAVALGITLGEALAHVHERTDADGKPLEIVHRDLSPQNVMVSYGGELKLIDFGTARAENRRCHTVAGIVFAKPGYVAPEVANNTPGGVPADLYAFGIMLWELVAGRRFLVGDASQHLAAVGAGRRSPSPLAQLVGAPPELDQVVSRLTATSIEERYGSAARAVQDLGRLLQRAPSMADGDRSVRGRVANLMRRLYPAEPARSRAEFARLVAEFRKSEARPMPIPASPEPPASEPADPSLLPGTRYKLLRELGRGAMGVVHEAYHLDLYRTVALKVMSTEQLDGAAVERFKREARAIAALSHDNLIKIFETGVTEDGRPYYAMEHIHGESLDRRLAREKRLGWREVVGIGIQTCRALEAAHAAGFVHRDLKPANLLLTTTGIVKLCDFGVARSLSGDKANEAGDGEALVIVGTPEYMAPEQASAGEASVRSDLYALGAVMYELLSGYAPHVGATVVELLAQKRERRPAPPSARGEITLPRSLDALVMRLLDPEPARRPASADELRRALEHVAREPVRRLLRRRRLASAIVAVVGFAVVGIGGAALGKTELAGRARTVGLDLWHRAEEARASALARVEPPAPVKSEPRVVSAATLGEPVAAELAPSASEPLAVANEPSPAAMTDIAADDDGDVNDPSANEPSTNEPSTLAAAPTEASDGDTGATDSPRPADEAVTPEATATPHPAIAQSDALWAEGAKIRALSVLRRAARRAPNDAALHKALASRAEDMQAWGEAVKAGRRWALLDPSAEARVALARLERATGHRDRALSLVNAVLKEEPSNASATALLGDLRGQKVALRE